MDAKRYAKILDRSLVPYISSCFPEIIASNKTTTLNIVVSMSKNISLIAKSTGGEHHPSLP